MADGGQVERFGVVSACGKLRAIAQSTCLELTARTDIHYTNIIFYNIIIQTGDDNASQLLASPFGSAITQLMELHGYYNGVIELINKL